MAAKRKINFTEIEKFRFCDEYEMYLGMINSQVFSHSYQLKEMPG
jgi:hypothetical protein